MKEVEMIVEYLHGLRDRIADNIVTQGAYATGKTTESMEVVKKEDGAMLVGRHNFANLETGTPPGNFPGSRAIREWLLAKGIKTASDPDLENAVYAINWSIYQQGTVLFRQGGRDTIYTAAIDETIGELLKNVSAAVTERLADGIIGNLKLQDN